MLLLYTISMACISDCVQASASQALAAAVSQYEMPKSGVVHQLLASSPDHPDFIDIQRMVQSLPYNIAKCLCGSI